MRSGLSRHVAVLVCSLGVASAAAASSESRAERGLQRFAQSPECSQALHSPASVPMCLRAPAPDEPPVGTIGIMLDNPAHIAACFNGASPPTWEVQQMVERFLSTATTDRFNTNGSWPGPDNVPITLTWSFVPDGVSIPAGVGEPAAPSELFAVMDAGFATLGGRATWIAQFESVFVRWSRLAGVSYQRIVAAGTDWDDGTAWGTDGQPGLRGDVRIGMKAIDGANSILAYNAYPSGGGDMVLDSAELWSLGATSYRFLRNTIAHEHGHGLGLAHVCPSNRTKLMEPFITTLFDGPQQDDVRAAQQNYGDPHENNNTFIMATTLGPLAIGATLTPSIIPDLSIANAALTSIARVSDADWFKFTVSVPTLVTARVVPVGSFYPDYPQDAGCNTTDPNTNAPSVGNLSIALVAANGTTELASASVLPLGATETINGFLISPSADHYIKVGVAAGANEPQMYTLTVSGAAQPFSASNGTFADRIRLEWSSIPSTSSYFLLRSASNSRAAAVQIAAPSAGTLAYDDTGMALGVSYYYWLDVTTSGLAGPRAAAGPAVGVRGSVSADSCAAAVPIVPGGPVGFNTAAATTDGPSEGLCFSGAPGATDQVNADTWFVCTPVTAGPFTVRTCGSGFDTRLAAYAGTCPTIANSAAACSDNTGACSGGSGLQSSMRVQGVAGQAYRLRVGGGPGL